jgi:hypothetical protein
MGGMKAKGVVVGLAVGLVLALGGGLSADTLPGTLPPSLFSGRTARAYAVAAEIPDVLAGLYCYCRCDLSNGHRHLLDCFRDAHGAA